MRALFNQFIIIAFFQGIGYGMFVEVSSRERSMIDAFYFVHQLNSLSD